MLAVWGMIFSFAYNEMLFMVFFSRTLERRYSYKTTIIGTAFVWILHCLVKIPPFFYTGITNLTLLNAITMLILCIYQFAFFQGEAVKRVLSMVFIYVYMFFMEHVSVGVTCMIVGENQLMLHESNFTVIALSIMFFMLLFGFYPLLCLWNLLLKVERRHREGQLWLCVLLPLSQYFFMEYYASVFEVHLKRISIWFSLGLFLGVIADFYMFFLFYREGQQYQAEQRLLQEQELYRREQVYYECLEEGQREAERIRHDLQNYILMLKNIENNKNDGI